MRRPFLLLTSVALAVLLACTMAALAAKQSVGQTATVTLVGAGDIASCNYTTDSAMARLLGTIPGTVFTLGDNAYPDGTAWQFRNCYKPTWGQYKLRTRPTAGNHDYHTTGARPYFDYFKAVNGFKEPRAPVPNSADNPGLTFGKGYYSYDRGAWHIVALNSNCEYVGGCDGGSAQVRWLANDLRRNWTVCTLAYWHHPLFSSGENTAAPPR